jgi:hypothetical protein
MWPKCVLVTQLIEFEFQALMNFPSQRLFKTQYLLHLTSKTTKPSL